jgi:hypothetical protein
VRRTRGSKARLMPAFKNHTGRFGVPGVVKSLPAVRTFSEGNIPIFEQRNFAISGVTKDGAGTPIPNCRVCIYRQDMAPAGASLSEIRGVSPEPQKACVWTGLSDGGGNFSAGPFAGNSGLYFAVAFNPGGTLAGLTLNNVAPS